MAFRALALIVAFSLAIAARAEELQDSCVCSCCFDRNGNRDCINPSATTFLANRCDICNVTSCATKFPRSCGLRDVNIIADCVERTNWYLRLIPVMFMISTVALVFYGIFIKSFDGYHPIDNDRDTENPPTLSSLTPIVTSPTAYQAITTTQIVSPLERLQRHAVKRPSPLSQTAPLTAPTTPTGNSKQQFEFPNVDAENVDKALPLDSKEDNAKM